MLWDNKGDLLASKDCFHRGHENCLPLLAIYSGTFFVFISVPWLLVRDRKVLLWRASEYEMQQNRLFLQPWRTDWSANLRNPGEVSQKRNGLRCDWKRIEICPAPFKIKPSAFLESEMRMMRWNAKKLLRYLLVELCLIALNQGTGDNDIWETEFPFFPFLCQHNKAKKKKKTWDYIICTQLNFNVGKIPKM